MVSIIKSDAVIFFFDQLLVLTTIKNDRIQWEKIDEAEGFDWTT